MRNIREVIKIVESIELDDKISKFQQARLLNNITKLRNFMMYEAYKLGVEDGKNNDTDKEAA